MYATPVNYEDLLSKAEVLQRHPEAANLAKYVIEDIERGRFTQEQRESLLLLLRGEPGVGYEHPSSGDVPGVSQ